MVIRSQLEGLTKRPKNDLRRQRKKTGLEVFIVVIIYKGGAAVRVPLHSRGSHAWNLPPAPKERT